MESGCSSECIGLVFLSVLLSFDVSIIGLILKVEVIIRQSV